MFESTHRLLSPASQGTPLMPDRLEENGLRVNRCPKSGGVWIRPAAWWAWLEQQETLEETDTASRPADSSQDAIPDPPPDVPTARRCPEDGQLLTRRSAVALEALVVERCSRCGGFWLDAGEFEALRDRGIEKQLHLIFSDVWQRRLRERRSREAAAERLNELLGADDAAEARRVQAWIKAHPQGEALLAFIQHG